MTLDELIARGLISPGAAARVGLDIGDDSVAVPTPDQQAMTHYDVDPAAEEVGRRVRQTGQNLWNTVTAPYRTAEDLGRQMRQGTLDVTDPQTAGAGLNLAWYAAGGRMPFAQEGAVGALGGKPFWESMKDVRMPPTQATRADVLGKLMASGDFNPQLRLADGRMWFKSLSPAENEEMNRIGWSRAPNVTFDQEISRDPQVRARAWQQNIRYWHDLANPKGDRK